MNKENEDLINGKEIEADCFDNHAEHIYAHKELLCNPKIQINPKIAGIVLKHIQSHIDLLRESQE